VYKLTFDRASRVANLGWMLAERGKRVVMVDADLDRSAT
jgi:MinD-like ATPase involved in chromosome partitioning or flagellar assembly